MRFQSKQRAKSERTDRKNRVAFVLEFGFCWACLTTYSIDCHEMAKGCHRGQAIKTENDFTWFSACNDCNQGCLNDYSEFPLERQLALKYIFDRTRFDLVAFNRLRGRDDNAITMADLRPWIRKERRRVG